MLLHSEQLGISRAGCSYKLELFIAQRSFCCAHKGTCHIFKIFKAHKAAQHAMEACGLYRIVTIWLSFSQIWRVSVFEQGFLQTNYKMSKFQNFRVSKWACAASARVALYTPSCLLLPPDSIGTICGTMDFYIGLFMAQRSFC